MSDRDRFDRFTADARRVLTLSQEEAQRFQHNYIGTEHLLLGMIRDERSDSAQILLGLGMDLQRVRRAVEFLIKRGDRTVLGEIGLTPRSKKVIELAVDETRRLGHDYIGSEHLLLGLILEGEGIGWGVLDSLGVDLDKARNQTLRYLATRNESVPLSSANDRPSVDVSPPPMQGSELSPETQQILSSEDRFDRFTERARRVLSLAQEEAQRFQHNYIGSEHLLLGMVREGEGVAAQALLKFNIDLQKVRSAVEFIIGRGDRPVLGEIGLTPRSRKVVELAVDETVHLHHHYVGTEHLLLGLIRGGDGIGVGVLESLGVNLEDLRLEVFRLLTGQPYRSGSGISSSEPQARASSSGEQQAAIVDRFTASARRVLSLAQEEAERFQLTYIGTEHLLLGMVREGESVTSRILLSREVNLQRVRSAVEVIIGRGDRNDLSEIGLTPRSKKVIELAVGEARRLVQDRISPEHFLLGLIHQKEGIGLGILESLGVDVQEILLQTLQNISAPAEQALIEVRKISTDNRFADFTKPAKRLLDLAHEEALYFLHNYVGTEHLLLGLIDDERSVAVQVLVGLGVELKKIRAGVEFIVARGGDRIVLGEMALTPRSKKVIQLAIDEARRLNHDAIGPEHILLGLIREGEGIAAGVLESLEVSLEKARRQTIQLTSVQPEQPVPVEPQTLFPGEITLSHRIQLFTIPFCHVTTGGRLRTPITNILLGAAAAAQSLPLGLAHDLGLLLSLPAGQLTIARPSFLPFDEDTSGYLACLERLAAHPLVRELSTWSPPLADTALGVVLARLVEGLDLPQEYRWPAGPDAARFLRALEYEMAHADPAALWEQTLVDARPTWRRLLPPAALSRLERNMQALDREELHFLARYGPTLPGSPDPRMLLDLLTLTDLPAPARLALSQTLQLVPQVSAHIMQRLGGVQTYPEGGYEGLARQGSLESLLPGENVYPEEVFLHRVLNQEALYYGRERPREQRRELAYLVGQLGWGLGDDGQVLVRALLLALGQAMRQRGYEVLYSLAGATLSSPGGLEKPAEIARLLYTQESGRVNSEVVLQGVLERLRSWSGQYRGRRVLWVLGEDFDVDSVEEHCALYQALRAEGEQHVWYVRVGEVSNGPVSAPRSAQAFGRWQMVETGRLWSHEKAGIA